MESKPTSHTYDSFLALLRRTEAGCLAESFVKVEHGEEFFKIAWMAFADLADYFDESYLSDDAMLNQFLLMLDDEVDLKDAGLKVCV